MNFGDSLLKDESLILNLSKLCFWSFAKPIPIPVCGVQTGVNIWVASGTRSRCTMEH